MLSSPLSLEVYYIEAYSFATNEKILTAEELPPDPTPQDIDVGFELWDHPRQNRRIACRLSVATADAAKESSAYTFDITLMGIFRVAEHFPAERLQNMVKYNAPALLYSAAREFVAMTTGRGGVGPLTLPTVSFIEREPIEASEKVEKEVVKATNEKKIPERSAKAKGKAH